MRITTTIVCTSVLLALMTVIAGAQDKNDEQGEAAVVTVEVVCSLDPERITLRHEGGAGPELKPVSLSSLHDPKDDEPLALPELIFKELRPGIEFTYGASPDPEAVIETEFSGRVAKRFLFSDKAREEGAIVVLDTGGAPVELMVLCGEYSKTFRIPPNLADAGGGGAAGARTEDLSGIVAIALAVTSAAGGYAVLRRRATS